MVNEEYWQEKRLEFRHVLSAWALVVALLALCLVLTNMSGRLACEWAPTPDGAEPLALPGCTVKSQPTSAVAEQRVR